MTLRFFSAALISTACLFAQSLSAETISLNGLKYEITHASENESASATLLGIDSDFSSAALHIPAHIEYEGEQFTVTAINNKAFAGITTISEISVPASITSIGEYAFSSMTSLQSVQFAQATALTELTKHIFENCSALKSISLPEGIKAIGERAFCECANLEEIYLPSTLTTLKDDAFIYCIGVNHIYCTASVPPSCSGNYIFYDFIYKDENKTLRDQIATVHVPKEAEASYREHAQWGQLNITGDYGNEEAFVLRLKASQGGTLSYIDFAVNNSAGSTTLPSSPARVLITATPEDDYEFESLTATTADGESVHYPFTHKEGAVSATIPFSDNMLVSANFATKTVHDLKIYSATTGEMLVKVPNNQAYNLLYTLPNGWHLNNALYNDSPLETETVGRNQIQIRTPRITAPSSLQLVLSQTQTGNSTIPACQEAVQFTSTGIVITGLQPDSHVNVSTPSGSSTSHRTYSSTIEIPLEKGNIYIVQTPAAIYKLAF